MSYNVTISPSGKQFEVDAETSVLEAALDAGHRAALWVQERGLRFVQVAGHGG